MNLNRIQQVLDGAEKHEAQHVVLDWTTAQALLNVALAGQAVVDHWESHQLAQAVRALSTELADLALD